MVMCKSTYLWILDNGFVGTVNHLEVKAVSVEAEAEEEEVEVESASEAAIVGTDLHLAETTTETSLMIDEENVLEVLTKTVDGTKPSWV